MFRRREVLERQELVLGLQPFEVGTEFTDLPTGYNVLADWFTDAKPAKLQKNLEAMSQRNPSFHIELGRVILTGAHDEREVRFVHVDELLKQLRFEAMMAVAKSGGEFIRPMPIMGPAGMSYIETQGLTLPEHVPVKEFALVQHETASNVMRVEQVFALSPGYATTR